MRGHLSLALLFLLLGAFLASVACGGGGSPRKLLIYSPQDATQNSGQAQDVTSGQGGQPGPSQSGDEATASDEIIIYLRYSFSPLEEGESVDVAKMEESFKNEPTVLALQEMGFEYVSYGAEFLAIVYAGVFRLAEGWTFERARDELPKLFPDIEAVDRPGNGDYYGFGSGFPSNAIFVTLQDDTYEQMEPWNIKPGSPEDKELEARFRAEPTVITLQEMGFELLEVSGIFYSGIFSLPTDWTGERASKELPTLFSDIAYVGWGQPMGEYF